MREKEISAFVFPLPFFTHIRCGNSLEEDGRKSKARKRGVAQNVRGGEKRENSKALVRTDGGADEKIERPNRALWLVGGRGLPGTERKVVGTVWFLLLLSTSTPCVSLSLAHSLLPLILSLSLPYTLPHRTFRWPLCAELSLRDRIRHKYKFSHRSDSLECGSIHEQRGIAMITSC